VLEILVDGSPSELRALSPVETPDQAIPEEMRKAPNSGQYRVSNLLHIARKAMATALKQALPDNVLEITFPQSPLAHMD